MEVKVSSPKMKLNPSKYIVQHLNNSWGAFWIVGSVLLINFDRSMGFVNQVVSTGRVVRKEDGGFVLKEDGSIIYAYPSKVHFCNPLGAKIRALLA